MSLSRNKFTITVLAENTVTQRGLIGEHGLSFWIESEKGEILFDTGQGVALPINAEEYALPLEKARAIVLSHGHYDHTGGLLYVLGKNSSARIFLHPDALKSRYHKPKEGEARKVGMAEQIKDKLRSMEERITWTTISLPVMEGVHISGPIPRKTLYEDTGGDLFLDAEGKEPDLITDDQALWLETSKGIVVLLGCAHSGVVNTLQYIAELTERKDFYAVLGGMHLVRASSARLNATAEALHGYHPQILAPAHCTGFTAISFLHQHFANSFQVCATGSKFVF